MKPGTKVKIIDTSGQFPKGLMGTEGEVIRSSFDKTSNGLGTSPDNRSLIRIPNQTDTWIYNFRLEEIKDEQEKEVR